MVYVYGRTEKEISNGQLSYFIQTNGKARTICFWFPYEESTKLDQVAYSISILQPISLISIYIKKSI